jgi:NAD(P)-dependent dehydrogenase (short-subunit alcohol dehydrogenase family)
MDGLFDLTGKVVIFTGGAGGIGRIVAPGMAQFGADVIIADSQTEPSERVVEKIRTLGRKALHIPVDVSQEQSVANMLKKAVEVFPRIDILINAAFFFAGKPAVSFPIDEWQKAMDVTIRGTFLCCQALGRLMIKQGGGRIINFSSVRGRYGLPEGYAAYCSSKGAVDTLTRTLACEWAKYNILVNAVAPTVVETEVSRERLGSDSEWTRMMKARIPLGRWAIPEDILGPIVFLASKAADFITGQIIYIDGGVTAW